jgi:hypothetical protein
MKYKIVQDMLKKFIRDIKKKRNIVQPCRSHMDDYYHDDCYIGDRWIVVPIKHCTSKIGSFIVIDTLKNEEYEVNYFKRLTSKQKKWIVLCR